MARKPHNHDEVYSITSAKQAHTEDISHRERNYAVSMAIRTACFIGGVIAWFHITWLGVVLFLGALILPYTSVILANAGVRRPGEGTNLRNVNSGELTTGDTDEDNADAGDAAGDTGTDHTDEGGPQKSDGTEQSDTGGQPGTDERSDGREDD